MAASTPRRACPRGSVLFFSSFGALPMTAAAVGRPWAMTRVSLVFMAWAVCVGNAGCSHFKARRQGANRPSAVLGVDLPSRDIYAQRPPTGAEPAPVVAADPPSRPDTASPGGLVTAPPAEDLDPSPTEPVVQLQPPVLINSARIGTMPTNAGVPDGARLIAASRPIARTPASAAPATPAREKTTTRIVSEARAALNAMTTYQVALKRRERVNGTLLPPEDLLMSIRRSPKAARLTWVDGPHQGREVLYRADEPGGLMHVNMADSKLPLPRLSIAPDSPMVMRNSRHPITEAGLDPIVASMEQADKSGTLTDLSLQTPAPLDHPHQGIEQRTEAGDVWRAYFDPASHLLALVECRAGNGDLLESYLFQNIQPDPPELATAAAFDPEARWGAPRGLFNRASARSTTEAATTR